MYSTLFIFISLLAPQSPHQVEVVYSTVPGDSSNQLPGSSGESFSYLYGSQVASNGLAAFAAHDQSGRDVLIRGHQVTLREGEVVPSQPNWTVAVIGNPSTSGRGQTVVGGWLRDTTQPQSYLGVLLEETGQGWRSLVREGDSIPGWNGFNYGVSFGSVDRLDDGRVAFQNTWLPGDGSDYRRTVLVLDNQPLARAGIDVPSGQSRVPAEPWQDFVAQSALTRSFMVSADGATWASVGRVGSTFYSTLHGGGEVFAVNNTVIAEEGYPVVGTHFTQPFRNVNSATLSADGRWWLCGSNEPGGAPGESSWLMSNGVVVAEAGDPIYSGSLDTWSALSLAASQGAHEYWVGYLPYTGGVEPQIVVHNRSTVVLRTGDALDLDGDGVSEGYEFLQVWGNRQFVDEHGRLTLMARIEHSVKGDRYLAQLRIHPSALRLDLPEPVAGSAIDFGVREAEPGAIATVAYSIAGPGASPLTFGTVDVLLDLAGRVFTTAARVVDAQGNADWSRTIPLQLAGVELRAQGVILHAGKPTPTNLRTEVVR